MKRFLSLSVFVAIATLTRTAFADTTALDLVKEGNRYVGEQSKDKVVEILSEKSIANLTPRIWTVVYFDPTATFKSVQVRFEAGKMKDVKRPMRVLQIGTGEHKTLDM